MNNIKSFYSNLKIEVLKKEYESITDKDVIKLYDFLTNVDENDIELYSSEVFLLMTDYLFPIHKYPIMRELIKKMYNYHDKYLDDEDHENIKNTNIQIMKILLDEKKDKIDIENLNKDDESDQYLLSLIQAANELIEEEKQLDEKQLEEKLQEEKLKEEKIEKKESKRRTKKSIENETENKIETKKKRGRKRTKIVEINTETDDNEQ